MQSGLGRLAVPQTDRQVWAAGVLSPEAQVVVQVERVHLEVVDNP